MAWLLVKDATKSSNWAERLRSLGGDAEAGPSSEEGLSKEELPDQQALSVLSAFYRRKDNVTPAPVAQRLNASGESSGLGALGGGLGGVGMGGWVENLKDIHTEQKAKRLEASACQRKLWPCLSKTYHFSGAKHLIMILLVLLYIFLGGVVYSVLEYTDTSFDQTAGLEKLRLNISQMLGVNVTSAQAQQVISLSGDFSSAVGASENPYASWDLGASLFFAFTIVSTIGYGNVAPTRTATQFFTIAYGFVGIPLMLACLSEMGALMFQGWAKLWRRLFRLCRRGPREEGEPKGDSRLTKVRMTPALVLLMLYLVLASALFIMWEDWSFEKSLYFSFISLSTIGLGDVTPASPRTSWGAGVLILGGLAVLALVVNTLQSQVEAKYVAALTVMETAYEANLAKAQEDEAELKELRLHRHEPRQNLSNALNLLKSQSLPGPSTECLDEPSPQDTTHDSIHM